MIGEVIKIPDEYTLVVSRISANAIAVGDQVAVYEVASDILDPKTHRKLGTYDFIKQTLEVTEVYEKYFICKTTHTITYNPFSFDVLPDSLKTTVETVPLKVDDEQNENLHLKDEVIRIGDPVKKYQVRIDI